MSRLTDTTSQGQHLEHDFNADKSAFVSRLQTILAHWPSADRLARAMGVSPSAFRKWLKGEAEPSRERLVALARTTGVGVAWLAEGEGPPPAFEVVAGARRRPKAAEPAEEQGWSQFVVLPDQPAAPAGSQAPAMSGFMALRHDWVRAVCGVDPDNLRLVLANDDSMMPTIRSGDTLLIDTTDRSYQTLGVYMMEINGLRMVKRVQRKHDGSLVLISDNPACQVDVIDSSTADKVVVIGRVVWAGGTI
jgi:phage repressor protein C with HTH and peptisase S24 domain